MEIKNGSSKYCIERKAFKGVLNEISFALLLNVKEPW